MCGAVDNDEWATTIYILYVCVCVFTDVGYISNDSLYIIIIFSAVTQTFYICKCVVYILEIDAAAQYFH